MTKPLPKLSIPISPAFSQSLNSLKSLFSFFSGKIIKLFLVGVMVLGVVGSGWGQSQTFTSSGSWTVPTGVTSVTIQVWGGGGGGSDNDDPSTGTGGGGGGYASKIFTVTPGQVINFTIGGGGGGSTSASPGGNGGTTTITGFGISASGGQGSGAGGSGSGGTTNATGGQGQANTNLSGINPLSSGGRGGGAGGPGGNGFSGVNGGAGNGSNAGSGGAGAVGATGNGGNGGSYGGGGGGSGNDNTGDPQEGGAGGTGAVIFTWVACPTISISASNTAISCFGGTISANLSGIGGSFPYTFSGSGVSGSTLTNVAGTYTVTVTDANNCTGTGTVTLTQPSSSITLGGTQVNVLCKTASTGSIDLTVSGGSGSYNYIWTNGATTQDLSGIPAGSYTVTVTDQNGCSVQNTKTFTITEPATILAALGGSQTNISCNGGNNGTITLNAPTGGTPGYTYLWNDGTTTQNRNTLTSGTYSVTVTDANGCKVNTSFTLTQPAAVSVTLVLKTDVICNGASTGALDITPNGGTGAYTYQWTGGVTTQDRTGLVAGTYTVTVTDANSCTGTASYTITQPPLITLGGTQVNVLCKTASTGSIDLTVSGGSGSYNYIWTNGATTQDLSGIPAGSYTVTVTDQNGCSVQNTKTFTITEPATILAALGGSQTNISCNGGNNGTITLNAPTGGTPGYTYLWNDGTTTQNRNTLTSGTYSVTVTDANGCKVNTSFTLTQPAAVSVTLVLKTDVICNGASTGALDITPNGGTGAYTYQWTGGVTTQDRTGLVAGTYTVTVTDANSCTGTASYTITQPPLITLGGTQVNVLCKTASTGSIDLTVSGGSGSYNYIWTNGATTQDLSGIPAGSYTVTVTDQNGCSVQNTKTFTITEPATILAALGGSQTNISCNGGNNGTITLNAPTGGTPGYTYLWNDGTTTQNRNTLTSGTYSVTVTDANGCKVNTSFTLTQPAAVSVTLVLKTDVICNGASTGALDITPNGGTGAYTYQWTGGVTTQDRTGLVAGTYTVTVTDANSCTGTASYTITENPLIAPGIFSGTSTCFGQPTILTYDPDDTAFGIFGPPFIISYKNNTTGNIYTQSFFTNAATNFTPGDNQTAVGTYTYSLVSINAGPGVGCNNTVSAPNANVIINPTPVSNPISNQIFCNGLSTTTILLTGSPSGVVFDISGGGPIGLADQTSITQIPSFTAVTGTATIIVTPRANGCTGLPVTFTITVRPTPTVTLSGDKAFCQNYSMSSTDYPVVTNTSPLHVDFFYNIFDSRTSTTVVNTDSDILTNGGTYSIEDFPINTNTPGVITYKLTKLYYANTLGGPDGSNNGCEYTLPSPLTSKITINPLPTAVIALVGSGAACSPNTVPISVTFTGTGPWNFSYKIDNGAPINIVGTSINPYPINASVTGNYTLTAISDANCVGTFTGSAQVTINPLPTPVITEASTNPICAGTSGWIYSTPNVAGNTYAWSVTGGTITAGAGTNSITVTWNNGAIGTIDLKETISATGCFKDAIQKAVNIKPLPTAVLSGGGAVCFPATLPLQVSFTGTGPWNFSYKIDNGTPIDIIGTSINLYPINASITGNYTLTAVSDAYCVGTSLTGSAGVTINPLPTPVITGPSPVCAGTTGSVYSTPNVAGNTYAWNVSANGTITAGTGTNSITVTWGTGPTGTVNVTETITATGCFKAATTLPISINPTPVITAMAATTCSGTAFTVTPINGTNGTVPIGTTYSWVAPVVAGITGAQSGTNLSSITGNLTNTTNSSITVTYVVTPTTPNANGTCDGVAFNVDVTVFPTPVSNPISNQTFCNGLATTAIPLTGSPSGVVFDISGGGPIGLADQTSITQIPSFTAVTGTATITVTPRANGCTGVPVTFTITVRPTPTVTLSGDKAFCQNYSMLSTDYPVVTNTSPLHVDFFYNIFDSRTSTTVVNTDSDILTNGGTYSIEDFPINTNTPGVITYKLTKLYYANTLGGPDGSNNGCEYTLPSPLTSKITINPLPTAVIALVGSGAACSPNTVPISVTFTGTGPWNFSYKIDNGAPINIVGTSINPYPINASVTGNYTLTAISDANCVGTFTGSAQVTINPLPTPVITEASTNPICAGTSGWIYSTPNVAGNTYAWSVTGGTITAGAGTNSITVTWNNGAIGTIDLKETISATGCFKDAIQKAVNIKPLPTAVLSGGGAVCFPATLPLQVSFTGTGPWNFSYKIDNGTPIDIIGTSINPYPINASITGNYTLTAVSDAYCVGTSLTGSAGVTINPLPTPVITGPSPVCAGTTGSVYSTPNVAGNTYAWNVSANGTITAGAGTNSITVTWGTGPTGTVNVTETITATGCSKQATSFPVTINSTPVITAMAATTCSGTAFTVTPINGTNGTVPIGTTYSWGPPTGAGFTGGVGGSGNSITGNLINTGTSSVTATYSVTPTTGTCVGTAFNVNVILNPLPNNVSGGFVHPNPSTVCLGSPGTLIFDPLNAITNFVLPYTIEYTDGVSFFTQIIDTDPKSFDVFPIVNTTYTITKITNGNGCVRTNTFGDDKATINVAQPTTAIAGSNFPICANSVNVNITSGASSTNNNGIAWTSSGSLGTITNPNSLTTALYTPSAADIASGSVTLTLTANANTPCTNAIDTKIITINANPTITLGTNPSICQGILSASLPYSATTGSPDQYSIDFDAAANSAGLSDIGFTGLPASSISIAIPSNITSGVYNGTILVKNSGSNCISISGLPFTVTIKATPVLDYTGKDLEKICANSNRTISSSVSGTLVNWTASNADGFVSGFPISVTNLPTPTDINLNNLVNSGTSISNIRVQISGSVNNCPALPIFYDLDVYPHPTIGLQTAEICSGNYFTATPTNLSSSFSIYYRWTIKSVSGSVSGFSASPSYPPTNQVISQPLTNTGSTDAVVTYSVTPGTLITAPLIFCEGPAFDLVVTVKPKIIPIFTQIGPLCSGDNATLPATSNNGITGTWSPSTINNIAPTTQTNTTYTFTPTPGLCASTATMEVVVNPILSPVVSCGNATSSSVTFNWGAVSGASGYDVSYQIGTTTYSIGPIGNTLTYTATSVTPGTSVVITVTPTGSGCFGASLPFTCNAASCNISVTANPTPASCNGGNGSAALSATGGNGIYSFSSSGGSVVGSTLTAAAGTYTITATDGNLCTGTISVTIGQAVAISVTANPTPASCNGGNGSAALSATGGNGIYSFSSSGGSVVGSTLTAAAGTYTITATDGNLCTGTISVTIGQAVAISVTANPTPASCNGGNGSAALSATGGNGIYSFSSSGGSVVGSTLTAAAGTYTITATDGNLCTGTISVTIGQAVAISVTANPTPASCNGGNGSAALSATGGNGIYSFSSSGGSVVGSTLTAAAGTYTITATDGNLCTGTISVTIGQAVAISVTANPTPASCNGGNGSAALSATGGNGIYSFSSSGGSVVGSTLTAAAGTYTITATDGNLCTGTISVTIGQAVAISVTANPTPASCNGGNGSAALSATGGNGIYSFSSSGGSVVGSTLTAAAGTYTITATDGNLCTGTISVTIGQAVAISVTANPTPASCNGGNGSAALSATGGNGIYSFSSSGGSVVGSTLTAAAGTYTITATDGNLCTGTISVTIGQAVAISVTANPTPASCNGGNGSAALSATGGNGIYSFSSSGGSVVGSTLTAAAGTYTITATDGNLCTGTISVTIGQAVAISVTANPTPASCNGGNGSAALSATGGNGIYSFSSSGGSVVGSTLTAAAGTYTITATDGNLCTGTISVTIGQAVAISVTANPTPASCNGGNGSAALSATGGNGIYSFSSSGGSVVGSTLTAAAGTYTITATDGNLCTGTISVTIGQAVAISVTANPTPASCNGGNGSAALSATGGNGIYSFSSSGGSVVGSTLTAAAGTYTITATDGNLCTGTISVTIGQAVAISVTANPTPASCNGGNGSAALSATGGNGIYSFSSSGGSVVGSTLTAAAGTYTITATDGNLCTGTISVTIGQAVAISVTANPTPASCNGGDGSAALSATGGNGIYSFSSSGGSVVGSTLTAAAGTYTITATDGNLCTGTISVTIGQAVAISVTANPTPASCNGGNGSAALSATGGNGIYSFSSSGGSVVGSTLTAAAGTYTITATDGNLCTGTISVTIGQAVAISVTANPTPASCNGGNGSAALSATGGNGIYSFSSSGGSVVGSTLTAAAGTYTITATDGNLCTGTISVTIGQAVAISVTANPTPASCNGGNGSAALSATGGNGIYSFSSSGGSVVGSTLTAAAGTYTITATDGNLCTGTISVTIGQAVAISVTANPTPASCNGGNGSAALSATGGNGIYSFSSSGGSVVGSTLTAAAGTYTITATDGNLCTGTISVTIGQAVAISVTANPTPASCNGGNGSAALSATGGNGIYSFSSSGGSVVGSTLTAAAGTYTITATDGNLCTGTISVTIGQAVAISVTANPTPASCNGGNGSAALSATGGNGIYSFSSSGGSVVGSTLTAAAGTYTITATDGNLCTGTISVTIGQAVAISVTANPTPASCNGGNGSAALSATGGNGIYSFSSSGGSVVGSTLTAAAGTYTITATDGNLCTGTISVTIGQAVAISVTANPTPASCNGGNGSAALSATGGNGIYSFSSSGGSVVGSTLTAAAGTYTITATDGNLCTGTISVTIGQAVAISVTANPTPASCNGGNGSAALSATGGNGIYSFSSSGGSVVGSTLTAAAGTYTITATDGNLCTGTISVTIGQAVAISVTANPTPASCNGGNGSAALSATGGNGIYSFSSSGGSVVGSTLTAAAGTYTITATDGNLCTGTISVTIGQAVAISVTANPTPASCNGGNGSAALSATGGNGIYSFSSSGGSVVGSTLTAAAGTYTITATDGNLCTGTISVTIGQAVAISVTANPTPASCNGGNGSAALSATGGNGIYSFSSSGGSVVGSTLTAAAGTYTITATDGNLCTGTISVTIGQAVAISVTANPTPASCNGGNGSAALSATGGNGIYSFSSSGGSVVGSTLTAAAGTYTITATDGNLCTGTISVTIGQAVAISVTANPTPASCNGGNGSAALSATGGNGIYSFSSSGGSVVGSTLTAAAGTYTITATDGNLCTGTISVTIGQAVAISVTANPTPASCNGGNGSAALSATGGNGIYSFSSSGGSVVGSTLTAAAGTYTITATDGNLCTGTISVTIGQAVAISVTANPTPASCNGGNGSAALSATGGNGIYSFSSSGGSVVGSTLTAAAGTYTITATDGNLCTGTISVTIGQATNTVVATITPPPTTTLNCSTTSISLTATGGGTYVWSSGGNSATTSVTTAGTYTVTVTAAGGCTATASIVITEDKLLPFAGILNDGLELTCTKLSSKLTADGVGTYLWSTGATTNDITVSTVGTFTVTVTGINGCSATASNSTTLNNTPPAGSISSDKGLALSCTIPKTILKAEGGASYLWSTGEITDTKEVTSAGTFTVTVTGANGCTDVKSVTTTSTISTITISETTTLASCGGNGTATINVTGGVGPYTYSVPGIAMTNNILTAPAATYVVTVKDANGCTATKSVVIKTEPDVIPPVLPTLGNIVKDFSVTAPIATTTDNCSGTISGTTPDPLTYTTVGPHIIHWTFKDAVGNITIAEQTVIVTLPGGFRPTPDMNVTFINVPVKGNVKTNDEVPSDITYGVAAAKAGNPTSNLPVVNLDGTYTFDSPLAGAYAFDVKICAPAPSTICFTELLFITVLDPNAVTNSPVANVDLISTPINQSVTINSLNNDSSGQPTSNILPNTVSIIDLNGLVLIGNSSQGGTGVVNTSTGQITYTPPLNYVGVDTLKYSVYDNQATSKSAQAYQIIRVLTASSANSTLAADDYKETKYNVPVSGNVKSNDSDPNGNSQTLSSNLNATIAGKGSIVFNSNGDYTFTPVAGFSGPVEFVYSVCDNGSPIACSNATLHLLVDPALLRVNPDNKLALINVSVNGNLNTNDVVSPGTTYGNVTAVTGNPNSTLPVVAADGTYTFVTPLEGVYVFEIAVCSPAPLTNCVKDILTITVSKPVITTLAPLAKNDIVSTLFDTAINIDVLNNDSPGQPNNNLVPGSVTIIDLNGAVSGVSAMGGTVSINPTNGSITYTPPAFYEGLDTLKYTVYDDQIPAKSASAFVLIKVLPCIAPPTDLKATATTVKEIKFAFTDNAFNELTYEFSWSKDGVNWTPAGIVLSTNTTTYIKSTGLEPETKYYFKVLAKNANCTSEYSNTVIVTTLPPAPNNLTAKGVKISQIDLAWTNTSKTATRIEIQNAVADGAFAESSFKKIDDIVVTLNANQSKNLIGSTKYRYRIRYISPSGFSAWSNIADASTLTITGYEGDELENFVAFYPIPVQNQLFIRPTVSVFGKINIRIINVLGIEVKQQEFNGFVENKAEQIEVSDLTPGVYFVEISTKKGSFIKKILKQ